jgi:hypothetical protein
LLSSSADGLGKIDRDSNGVSARGLKFPAPDEIVDAVRI